MRFRIGKQPFSGGTRFSGGHIPDDGSLSEREYVEPWAVRRAVEAATVILTQIRNAEPQNLGL